MRYRTPMVLIVLSIIAIIPRNCSAQWWSLQKLHSIVNDANTDELRPIVSSDGQTIFFTKQGSPHFNHSLMENGIDLSDSLDKKAFREKLIEVYSDLSGEKIIEPHLSDFNQDIWMLSTDDAGFASVNHLPSPINNAFPNSMCALSSDGKEAVLVNQFPKEGGIKKGFSLIQKRKDGSWSTPVPIKIEGLGEIEPDVNVALSNDAQFLILSFQRSDSYSRSNDLYISKRKNITTWETPMHLGPAINSPYHEAAPFLTADASKLFFSSNRRGGKGGSDIYYVERIGTGWSHWSAPQILNDPINSASDESHPYFIEKTGELFFSSKRDGSSDIFKIQIAPKESNLVEIAGTIKEKGERGTMEAIVISKPAGSQSLREIVKTKNGSYSMKIPKGKLFEIQAQKNGYMSASKEISFDPKHVFFKAVSLDFEMQVAEEGHSFVLDNIQFKQSTSELLTSSFDALEELADVLSKQAGIEIEITGHTDNQGIKDELFQLSKDRALSIKNYLVMQKNIGPNRISIKGVGDSQPLNLNQDEIQRSLNRRVEITIIKDNTEFMIGSN